MFTLCCSFHKDLDPPKAWPAQSHPPGRCPLLRAPLGWHTNTKPHKCTCQYTEVENVLELYNLKMSWLTCLVHQNTKIQVDQWPPQTTANPGRGKPVTSLRAVSIPQCVSLTLWTITQPSSTCLICNSSPLSFVSPVAPSDKT